MKKTIVVTVVTFISLTSPVIGIETTTTPTPKSRIRQEIREERQEMLEGIRGTRVETRQEIKQGKTEAKATITQTRQEFRQKRAKAAYDQVISAITARYNFILAVKTKLENRITEKETAGINMADAKAKLATFSDTQYKTDLATLQTKYQELLASSEPVNYVSSLREQVAVVRRDLNNLRQVEIDTLRLIIKSK